MEDFQERVINTRKGVASILYKVINNEITAKEAIDNYFNKLSSIDDSVDCALHALYHYRDDEDLRKKDKKYAESQYDDLKSMADNLSQGLPISKEHSVFYTPRVFSIKSILSKVKNIFSK